MKYWKSESTHNKSAIETEDRHAIGKFKTPDKCRMLMNKQIIPIVSRKQIHNNDPSL